MVLAIVFHCLGRSKNANDDDDDDDDDDDELRVRNMMELVTFVRTKIYAARTSRSSSSYGSISAARARPQQQTRRLLLLLSIDSTDGRRTDTGPFKDAYGILCGPRIVTAMSRRTSSCRLSLQCLP